MQARSKGRAPLLPMSQQNLNLSYWCFGALKIIKKNRIEKVMASQSRGDQKLQKQTTKCYKSQFPNT
jgi:hypothetical protein